MLGIQGRFITIPNLLSISRGVLIIPTMYFVLVGGAIYTAFAVCLGALIILSDIADGILARRTHSTSEWGKILDPLMDKFCIAIVGICAIIWREFPIYAAIIIFGRDIIIVASAYYLLKRKKILSVSHPIGKYTALATALTLVSYLVQWDGGKIYFLYLTLALMVASGAFYLFRAVGSLKRRHDGATVS